MYYTYHTTMGEFAACSSSLAHPLHLQVQIIYERRHYGKGPLVRGREQAVF